MSVLVGLVLSFLGAAFSFSQIKRDWQNGWGIILVYAMFGLMNVIVFVTLVFDLAGWI